MLNHHHLNVYKQYLEKGDQKVKLGLKDMSEIIDYIMPKTIIENLPYIIEDVENIVLNYLNFGCQNKHTSNTNDLYITVYKEKEQDQNGLQTTNKMVTSSEI